MPPKKKSKKKGSKKSKKGSKKGKMPKMDLGDEVLAFKEIYATLREEERVGSMEKDNETLKIICKELRLRLDRHLESQAQIIAQLNDEITKKDDTIADLMKLKVDLEQENITREGEYSDEIEKKEAEHQEHISQLLKEHADFDGKNRELNEFKNKRASIETRLDEYRKALEAEQAERVNNVNKLERRNVMEKDRLKNEMLRKIKETKLSLLAMTEDQLHTTTKRTIMENEQMTTELQYQSKETERIARTNAKLLKENRAMKRQLGLHDQQQGMLATRTRFFHKLIKKLTNQLEGAKHNEPKLVGYQRKENGQSRNLTRKQKATNAALLENEHTIASLEARVDDLEEMVRYAQAETEGAHGQLEATRNAAEAMFNLQEEAVGMTLRCLDDVNTTFRPHWEQEHGSDVKSSYVVGRPPTAKDDPFGANKRAVYAMPDSLTSMSPDQRETFLRMLLFKLNVQMNDNM